MSGFGFTTHDVLAVYESTWNRYRDDDINPEFSQGKMRQIHRELEEYLLLFRRELPSLVGEEDTVKRLDYIERIEAIEAFISSHPLPE